LSLVRNSKTSPKAQASRALPRNAALELIVGEALTTAARRVYGARSIKRRSTKAQVEARREALFKIIDAGRPGINVAPSEFER
jgi:hypothetical protein